VSVIINQPELKEDWQTRVRGKLKDEYDIYVSLCDDGDGHDIDTGLPLKTFDEWLNS